MMRFAVIAVLCLACGPSKQKPDPDPDPDPAMKPPPQTEIQRRQQAACEGVGKMATKCAVEDTKNQPANVQKEADPEHTAQFNTKDYVDKCVAQYLSSRQIRVFEVCLREETECGPFFSCLDNATPQK
jgi:hypothetical protein